MRRLPEGHGFTTAELKMNVFAAARRFVHQTAAAEALAQAGAEPIDRE